MEERKTPGEMFDKLTLENQKKVIRLIETLATSQLSSQPEPGSPNLNCDTE